MHGNMWEFCQDWYDDNYNENSPSMDPQGPNSTQSRVVRGGSWADPAHSCDSVERWDLPTWSDGYKYGLRLVREEV